MAQKAIVGEWMLPKLKQRETAITSLVVMPAQLTLTKSTMKGKQSLETENLKISPIVDRALVVALKEAGVAVSEATPAEAALAQSADLRGVVGRLQQDFDTITPVMFRKPKEVTKGRFKVAEESLAGLNLKDAARSDAILFVRGSGGRQTKAKAFAMGGGLIGAAFAGGLHINVVLSFVDAVTGEVLFVKGMLVSVKDENTEEKLTAELTKTLKKDKQKVFGGS